MRSDRLGVAVIGAGMAGRAHAAGYQRASTVYGQGLPVIDLVAISDLHEDFARETARRFGYRRFETDWRALLDADDIDVVSIVVANHLHREMAVALLEAGKHVLCEKPFAPTVADAQAMVTAAGGSDAQSGVGFTFRRSPAIGAVRERVLSSEMGAPVQFNGHYWCDYGADPNRPMSWRYEGGLGTGALADLGSHVIDTAEFLCGPLEAVSGAMFRTQYTERPVPLGVAVGHAATEVSHESQPVGNEDVVAFNGRFASGALATMAVSRIHLGHPNALGFELFCERGAAVYDLERPSEILYVDSTELGTTPGYRRVLIGPEHPYLTGGMAMDFPGVGFGQNDLFVFQARAFLEQVTGLDRLPHVPSFADGLRNLRLMAAVVQSAEGGGVEVAVPPTDQPSLPANNENEQVTAGSTP